MIIWFFFLIFLSANELQTPQGWECRYSEDNVAFTPWERIEDDTQCFKKASAGYAEYRILLNDYSTVVDDSSNIGIYLGEIGEAGLVLLNNKVIGKSGEFPPNYYNARRNLRFYYLGTKSDMQNSTLLVKTYSDYPVARGIRISSVKIGDYGAISKHYYWQDVFRYSALSVVIAISMCSFLILLGFLIVRPKQFYRTFAAAMCMAMTSYTFFLSRYPTEMGIQNLFVYKGIVISILAFLFFASLHAVSLEKSRYSSAIKLIQSINILFFVMIVFEPTAINVRELYQKWYFLFVFNLLMIVVHYCSIRNNVKQWYYYFGGILVFTLASLNDIFKALGFAKSVDISQYGLAIFGLSIIAAEVDLIIRELKFRVQKDTLLSVELAVQKKVSEAVLLTNKQVAHDIRSPLSALEILVSNSRDLSDVKKDLLKSAVSRIKEIANTLNAKEDKVVLDSKPEMLIALVDSIVAEKRGELSINQNINIHFEPNGEQYKIFSSINAVEFKRIISNIINNSIQAIGTRGDIAVELFVRKNQAIVRVIDNGCGIPSEIRDRVFDRDFTYGKSGGSGLGLSHAIENVKKWRGDIRIESTEHQQTIVEIILPLTVPPAWYLDSINLKQYNDIVIIDDNIGMHRLWQSRIKDKKLTHYHGTDKANLQKNIFEDSSKLFLIDSDFYDSKQSGLDFIEENKIKSAILLTGDLDNHALLQRCHKSSIKVIPKAFIHLISVS